jgi:hypothetical protein
VFYDPQITQIFADYKSKYRLDPQIIPVPSSGATGQAQIFADYKSKYRSADYAD